MVDYKAVVKGEIAFLIGVFIIMIFGRVMPPLIEVLSPIFSAADDIAWFLVVVVYILIGFIIPAGFFYKGITTKEENPNKFISVFMGIFFFMFNIILVSQAWYMVDTLVQNLSGFGLAVFWIGFVGTFVMATIVTPIYGIISAGVTEGE